MEQPNQYQLFHVRDDYLDSLFTPQGEAKLDEEIRKLQQDIDPQQLQQINRQFFNNEKIVLRSIFPQEQPNQDSHTLQKKQQPTSENHVQQEQSLIEQGICSTIPQQQQEKHYEIERQKIQENTYRIKYNNGDIYEGQIQNDMKNGWGQYNYASGQKYIGSFCQDQIYGFGHYFFLSGAEYEGDWVNGMKQGYGLLNFANGDQYIGGFYEDEFHGKGKYTYGNGDSFQGRWQNGKRHGAGQFQGNDGRVMIGKWKQDEFDV